MTADHYKSTYNKLLKELPKWKQLAIKEDSNKNHWSGVLTEFVQNVIYTAEKSWTDSPKVEIEMEEEIFPSRVKTPTKKS